MSTAAVKPPTTRAELLAALNEAARRQSTATVLFHAAVAERLGLSATDHKYADLIARQGPMTAGELAGGHRSLAGDQVRVLVIGGGEPQALGHGGVEQDRRGALAPRRLVQGGEELRARGRGLDGGGRHSLIN